MVSVSLLIPLVEPELVHFNTYTVAQITQIIKARLRECIDSTNLISEGAVELASRKVASCGDLRKALDILKYSINLAERESVSVTLKHVMKAIEGSSTGNNSKSSIIRELTLDSKALLLCSSVNCSSKGNFVLKHHLFQLYNAITSSYSWLNSFSRTEFDDVLTQLEAKGLFLLSKPQKDGSIKITCQFSSQELSLAIKDCTLLKTINMPIF